MEQLTVTIKNRACTRKAATADKIKALNERMANMCDKALAKEAAKDERKARRAEFKRQRQLKNREV
jgi:hypothetical protein